MLKAGAQGCSRGLLREGMIQSRRLMLTQNWSKLQMNDRGFHRNVKPPCLAT